MIAQRSSGESPVVLITGASNGIGRATAGLLARAGYRVYGASRRPERVEPLPGVTFLALDVRDADSIRRCVSTVLEQAGHIDALVNNAGLIGPGAAVEETDIQTARGLFETNFFGVVQVTNAVLPHMRARRAGKIINISSTTGLVPLPPFFAFYTASKHALEAYSAGLRHEVWDFGIQVALIEPGYTQTSIGASIDPPDHPLDDYACPRRGVTLLNKAALAYGSPPELAARAVLRALRGRHPPLRTPTGADTWGILAAQRLLPAPLFDRLARFLFLTWKPPRSMDEAGDPPAPAELGLQRLFFHGPTLNRWMPAAVMAAGALGAALLAKLLWRRH